LDFLLAYVFNVLGVYGGDILYHIFLHYENSAGSVGLADLVSYLLTSIFDNDNFFDATELKEFVLLRLSHAFYFV